MNLLHIIFNFYRYSVYARISGTKCHRVFKGGFNEVKNSSPISVLSFGSFSLDKQRIAKHIFVTFEKNRNKYKKMNIKRKKDKSSNIRF